jgi:hypothetical protein
MDTKQHEEAERAAGDTPRPNRADRRAQTSSRQHKHGTTAQVSPFDIAFAPPGRDQRERATATPPSRHGDRGDADAEPPLPIEENAGDLLVGRDPIRAFLISLGMPEKTDPYYLKRTGWPIGSTAADGGKLIASKRRLARFTQRLASPAS